MNPKPTSLDVELEQSVDERPLVESNIDLMHTISTPASELDLMKERSVDVDSDGEGLLYGAHLNKGLQRLNVSSPSQVHQYVTIVYKKSERPDPESHFEGLRGGNITEHSTMFQGKDMNLASVGGFFDVVMALEPSVN